MMRDPFDSVKQLP